MKDTIYREDAIKAIDDKVNGSDNRLWLKEIISEIQSADRPQEWIPCSERMPDLEEYVLVTLSYGVRMIMALDWDDGKIEWKTQEKSIIYDDEEAVAWMPLPKPWKGADDAK